jgi:hypothetical protein
MSSGPSEPDRLEPEAQDPAYHFGLGRLAQARGDFAGARDAYLRCLRLDPLHSEARHNLATLDTVRAPFRAIDGYVATLAQDPQFDLARKNLTRTITGWTCGVLFAFYLLVQVLGHAFTRLGDRLVLVALAVLVVGAVLAVWRLPTGARRALGRILVPGLTYNRPAFIGLLLGVAAMAGGITWLALTGVTEQAPGLLVGVGGILAIFSAVGVIVSVRDERRRSDW